MRDTVRQIVYCGICLQTFQLRRTKEDVREVTDLSCSSLLSRQNKGGFRPACAVRNFYPLRTCRSSILALAYSIFSPSCQTPPLPSTCACKNPVPALPFPSPFNMFSRHNDRRALPAPSWRATCRTFTRRRFCAHAMRRSTYERSRGLPRYMYQLISA